MTTNRAIASLIKEYGDNVTLGGAPKLERLSTGLPNVDWIFGGGLPIGRIVQIHGDSSAGKTLFALQCIKNAQSLGLLTAFIDMEKTMDKDRLNQIGINQTDGTFLFSRPDTGDEALLHVEKFAEAGIDLIVLDSIAACIPKGSMLSDADDHVDKNTIGEQARMFARWIGRITGMLSRNNVTLLALNQERTNISTSYGHVTPIKLPGGKAMTFYSSVIMKINRMGDSKKIKGNVDVKYTVNKNKTAINGRIALITNTPTGIDVEAAVQETLTNPDFEIFNVQGAGHFWHPNLLASGVLDDLDLPGKDGSKFGHGKEATIAVINANPILKEKLIAYASSSKATVTSLTLAAEEIMQFEE
jgi:protein RecA